jgi:hypothetical protein
MLCFAGAHRICGVKGLICLGDNIRRLLKLMDTENKTVPCACLPMCEGVSFQIVEEKFQNLSVSNNEFYYLCFIHIMCQIKPLKPKVHLRNN